MNGRSGKAQLALPGLAPLCPHCGGRRTEVAPSDEARGEVVSGQRWLCRGCGREFWSLPSLGAQSSR
jgi:uncharacterized protein with PIN domain